MSSNISSRWQWRFFKLFLIIMDSLVIGFAFWSAYFVRFNLSINLFELDANASTALYQQLVVILVPLWILIFSLLGLYDKRNLLGGTLEYERIFNAVTVGILGIMVASFFFPSFILARGWLVLAWVFSFTFTMASRFLIRRIVYSLRARGYFLANAVIIGANNEGISLAEQLTRWKTSGFKVLGFVDDLVPDGLVVYPHMRILGQADKLDEIVEQLNVEEIILASSSITGRDRIMEIFQRFAFGSNVNVRMSSGLYEIITTGLTVKEFAYVPLVGINKVSLTGINQLLKLLLDYTLTIPSLLLLSPIFLLIAIAIKLDSPGPVIYKRRVVGMNSRQFDAYKFRTMYVNGEEILAAHPELKSELAQHGKLISDPRVTRLGRRLRKASLDELPQLINVLKHEMSLVGPRMITPDELEKYEKWNLNLLTVRPGITGMWQVNGRSDVPYQERVRLDMHYIRNWSIWFDLKLLVQTIPAVLWGRGAY